MLGICIITYNIPIEVINLQIACIRKFCKDEHRIIIVDNSSDRAAIDSITYHINQDQEISYLKTKATSHNGSDSHAFAANLSYTFIKNKYDNLLYLDHDCIPVKDFSVKEILGEKLFAGIGHGKQKTYFWPGCFMFNNKDIDRSLVNFSPSHDLGLDTGGHTYQLIERYGIEKALFFDEQYVQNEHFSHSFYNFYTLINNGMFLHFVNASNWNQAENHEERLNSLINLTKKIVNL
jgi:glycosyltransferase involved in cell wall biosynthesis